MSSSAPSGVTFDGPLEAFYVKHGGMLMQVRISDAFNNRDAMSQAKIAFDELLLKAEHGVVDFDVVGRALLKLQNEGVLKDGTCYTWDGHSGFWESSQAILLYMYKLELALRHEALRFSGIEISGHIDGLNCLLPSDERWTPLARKSYRNRSDLCRWRAYLTQKISELRLRCQRTEALAVAEGLADEEEKDYHAALSFVMVSGRHEHPLPDRSELVGRFDRLLHSHPYLDNANHVLNIFVRKYRAHIHAGRLLRAASCVETLKTRMDVETQRLEAAFSKFDIDKSGVLDVQEFTNFVVYVGLGKDVVNKLCAENDTDDDGNISLSEFIAFVGKEGGFEEMFRARRRKMKQSSSSSTLEVGSRVLAHFFVEGEKSQHACDARILQINLDKQEALVRFDTSIVALEKNPEQYIPLKFINEDRDIIEALSEIGVDDKMYWATMLPPSEIQVLKTLEECQRNAIRHVRDLARKNHNEQLPDLKKTAVNMNLKEGVINQTLTWLSDFAPVISHLNLDRWIGTKDKILGRCLMDDELYKNLFDVRTGGGCVNLESRASWETEIFGKAYDDTSHEDCPSKRPKYGVLDVCNDPRGVPAAWHYGDSYFILKNVRLRSTFAHCDTCCVPDLAVLDLQAGVLNNYSEEELLEVVRVATALEGSRDRIGNGQKINNYKEAQIHGLVRFDRDILALVVNERHRTVFDPFNPGGCLDYPFGGVETGADPTKYHFGEKEVEELCAKHGWKLSWMSEEGARRMKEDRREY